MKIEDKSDVFESFAQPDTAGTHDNDDKAHPNAREKNTVQIGINDTEPILES